MTGKAVFSCGALSIYFSKEDLDNLLENGAARVGLYWEAALLHPEAVAVRLTGGAVQEITRARQKDRHAIHSGQMNFKIAQLVNAFRDKKGADNAQSE